MTALRNVFSMAALKLEAGEPITRAEARELIRQGRSGLALEAGERGLITDEPTTAETR